MTVTVRDIAKRVNVSHTMVSRALNANSKFPISAEKRELIIKAAEELGYRPNHAARALATGQSFVISLQLYDMENPHQMRVARIFSELLREDNYDLMVHTFTGESVSVRSAIDGVIMLDRKDSPKVNVYCPVISIGAFVSELHDTVHVDLKSGSHQALAHLVQSGRKRIALVSKEERDLNDGRTAAYFEAMEAAGLPAFLIHMDQHDRQDAWDAVSAFLKEGHSPDAFFCQNDQAAGGCYRALREAGLSIPDDVAVVGCDGVPQDEFVYPSLSSIEQPAEEMCRTAWKLLKQRIETPDLPRQSSRLESRFVLRASC